MNAECGICVMCANWRVPPVTHALCVLFACASCVLSHDLCSLHCAHCVYRNYNYETKPQLPNNYDAYDEIKENKNKDEKRHHGKTHTQDVKRTFPCWRLFVTRQVCDGYTMSTQRPTERQAIFSHTTAPTQLHNVKKFRSLLRHSVLCRTFNIFPGSLF